MGYEIQRPPFAAFRGLSSSALYRPPVLMASAFHAIQRLQVCTSLPSAADMLVALAFSGVRLVDLRVIGTAAASTTDVNRFLASFARNCHTVLSLYLVLDPPMVDERCVPIDWRGEALDDYALGPLREAVHLQVLCVRHVVAAQITHVGLLDITRHMQALTRLSLVTSPDWLQGPIGILCPPANTTLTTIARLVDMLPRLTHLGLYIDFAHGIPVQDDLDMARYACLERLDIGTSAIPRVAAAMGLSDDSETENGDERSWAGESYEEQELDRLAHFLCHCISAEGRVCCCTCAPHDDWGVADSVLTVDEGELMSEMDSRWERLADMMTAYS